MWFGKKAERKRNIPELSLAFMEINSKFYCRGRDEGEKMRQWRAIETISSSRTFDSDIEAIKKGWIQELEDLRRRKNPSDEIMQQIDLLQMMIQLA